MSKHAKILVIPAAGEGKRFINANYNTPKPFIDVLGIRMVELVIESMKMLINGDIKTIIIIRDDMKVDFEFDDSISIVRVPAITGGSAETVLIGLNTIPDDDSEIIVANCDQFALFDGEKFSDKLLNNDGCILTFEDSTKNPKWSFVETKEDLLEGEIIRVAEKNPISTHASVGVYLYKSCKLAKKAINDMINANDRYNNEFYLCPSFNYIKNKYSVLCEKMWGLGTPEDLENSLNDNEFVDQVQKIILKRKNTVI